MAMAALTIAEQLESTLTDVRAFGKSPTKAVSLFFIHSLIKQGA